MDKAGVGSAVLNSMRQVGGSLGIAIMGAIVAAGASRSATAAGRARRRSCTGFHHALEVAARASRSPARSSRRHRAQAHAPDADELPQSAVAEAA